MLCAGSACAGLNSSRCLKLLDTFNSDCFYACLQLIYTPARDFPPQLACCSEAGTSPPKQSINASHAGTTSYHVMPCETVNAHSDCLHQTCTCVCSPQGSVPVQLWLMALIGMMARCSPAARLTIALSVAALTAFALPSNLWRPQLKRLGTLALLIFVFTALGAGFPSQGLLL